MIDLDKWAAVPLEPTPDMIEMAGWEEYAESSSTCVPAPDGIVRDVLIAAIDARPTGPETPVLIDPARLRELERDAARLDWLENSDVCYWVDVQRQPDAEMMYAGGGPGLREAIDAALSAARGEGAG